MGRRFPDWLIYVGIVAGLTGGAILLQPRRPRPPPPPPSNGFAIAPATPFDPAVAPRPTDPRAAGAGTAFSIDQRGLWLTARHVVEGCARIAVVVGQGRGVVATARIDPNTETAVLVTDGGAPPLPIAPDGELTEGTMAFHPGFPHGAPGEAATRLMRRETLVLRRRREPVLAWKEVGRRPDMWGNLAGLSGAPALNAEGQVVGVTVAEAPRRRRLYTTTRAGLRAAVAAAGAREGLGKPAPMDIDNYDRVADSLRSSLRVAPVVCLGPTPASAPASGRAGWLESLWRRPADRTSRTPPAGSAPR